MALGFIVPLRGIKGLTCTQGKRQCTRKKKEIIKKQGRE